MAVKGFVRLAILAAAIIAGQTVLNSTVLGQSDPPKKTIEGTWLVKATPRDCVTGVPITAVTFDALMTFHNDGTLSAWFQNKTIRTTRSPSFGLWRSGIGWSDYKLRFIHLRYDLATGAYLGPQDSAASLTLSENGNEFTTDGLTELFDPTGVSQGVGCSNSVGTRYTLQP